ncbi:chymotrypsin-2-like [Nasonia vitripennis]|uniref:Peptidase S1 domain-containing protein n=1 Tax=Nasonia vitripennis TaxID=7425 RepID=A0A7M7PXX9_NASVI|nr:chymotrypsin-2-like [Nasonia vitripennis]XP_031777811.1 chymotrypsin-2-like [Nasonia vitripennis]XP_031777812.1 chymotrypsin-2-like [Nasonia vitripennis]
MKCAFFLLFIICTWDNILLSYVKSLEAEGIVGGDSDEENEFNYQVSIQVLKKKSGQFEHTCGGSIISAQFVLTASHCFVSKDDKQILDVSKSHVRILAGTNRQDDEDGIYRFIDKVYLNKNYSHSNPFMYGDIAVVKLDEKLDVEDDPRVSIIKIPRKLKYEKLVNKVATASGFGIIDFVSNTDEFGEAVTKPILPNTRQYIDVRIVSKAECTPYEHIICSLFDDADDYKVHGICNGDSGGPLVYKNALIGIVSRAAISCDMRKKTAKFTLVPYYNDFIIRAVRDDGDKSDMLILDGLV